MIWQFHFHSGITPAYAGKSPTGVENLQVNRDHPRICGEKLVKLFPFLVHCGITPAYAGKRVVCPPVSSVYQDHPRICGEKPNRLLWEHWKEGSPPHMRGKDKKEEVNE